MDSNELSEWIAYDQIEPLPDAHWDAGMMTSTMVNMFGKSNKRFKPADFMPSHKTEKSHSPEHDMAILDAMIKAQAKRKR